jgi:hypothetical protein
MPTPSKREINIATYGKDLNGVIYNEQLGFIRK